MAFCENCGHEVSSQAVNCPSCGHPQAHAGAAVARRTEGSATASLVLGIVGIVFCPLICSVLAIVLGNQAKRRIAADPALEGESQAKAGVILGWVGVGLACLGLIIVVLAAALGDVEAAL